MRLALGAPIGHPEVQVGCLGLHLLAPPCLVHREQGSGFLGLHPLGPWGLRRALAAPVRGLNGHCSKPQALA